MMHLAPKIPLLPSGAFVFGPTQLCPHSLKIPLGEPAGLSHGKFSIFNDNKLAKLDWA